MAAIGLLAQWREVRVKHKRILVTGLPAQADAADAAVPIVLVTPAAILQAQGIFQVGRFFGFLNLSQNIALAFLSLITEECL